MNSPSLISLDRYVYEDIYPSFKAATDEKEISADIVRAFLNHLAGRGLVLNGGDPAAVADIGCGPCDTLVKYLRGVSFPPGFIVRATDYLDKYADGPRGEAFQTLETAQKNKILELNSFETRAGDAFGGNIVALLSGHPDGFDLRHRFRVVFVSHVIYHADSPSGVERLISEIANELLDRQGICILFHGADVAHTFVDFRARFGSEVGVHRGSNTGAVTTDDPPAQIRTACDRNGLPLHEIGFIARVRFGRLREEEWRSFKDPQTYGALAESNPRAYEDLKRLYFVVQRAPEEFAADRSKTGLAAFVDEVRKAIEGDRDTLPLAERMQVFTRPDADSGLANAIPDALANGLAVLQVHR